MTRVFPWRRGPWYDRAVANVPRSILLAAVVVLGWFGAPSCNSGPTCIIDGVEEPVGKPFMLLGCGACTCDVYGDVTCENKACSGPGHPPDGAAMDSGSDAESGTGDASDDSPSD